jgi:hypothetical protein
VTILNTDGSRTQTIRRSSANGTVIDSSVGTVSLDSLTKTAKLDVNGDGVFDSTVSDVIVLNADGSRTQTVVTKSANGTQLAKSVTTISADRKTTTTTIDSNGDLKTDRRIVTEILADGQRKKTVTALASDGSVLGQRVTTVSGNGLTATAQVDVDGNGTVDGTVSEATVVNADGSRTVTVAERAGTTLTAQTVTTVSGNGLVKTMTIDSNGDGVIDRKVSDATTLNADGSRTRTESNLTGLNGLKDKTVTTVSANGLGSTVANDLDGNGTVDRTTSALSAINADGSVFETVTVKNASNTVIAKTTATTSADRRLISANTDLDGDGLNDVTSVTAVNADGSTTATTSTYAKQGTTGEPSVAGGDDGERQRARCQDRDRSERRRRHRSDGRSGDDAAQRRRHVGDDQYIRRQQCVEEQDRRRDERQRPQRKRQDGRPRAAPSAVRERMS